MPWLPKYGHRTLQHWGKMIQECDFHVASLCRLQSCSFHFCQKKKGGGKWREVYCVACTSSRNHLSSALRWFLVITDEWRVRTEFHFSVVCCRLHRGYLSVCHFPAVQTPIQWKYIQWQYIQWTIPFCKGVLRLSWPKTSRSRELQV